MTLRRGNALRRTVRHMTQVANSLSLLQINGSQLKLDLDSDLGITIGTGVSQWSDQSGTGNHLTQGTAGAQPAYVASVLDGHASVRTDAVNDCLNRINSFAGLAAGQFPYFYVVAASRAGVANYDGGLWELALTSVSNQCASNFHTGTGLYARDVAADATYVDGTTGARLVTVRFEAALVALDTQNVQRATVASAFGGLHTTPDDFTIGRIFSAFFGAYDLFKVVIVNGGAAPISAAQHAANIGYFRQRYPSLGL